ncbi:MAG: apolipoprotein N-acyltransferase [Burkholderia sp.]|nr:apolipoprotein N-acyltransferase [Burkholderia sp.]
MSYLIFTKSEERSITKASTLTLPRWHYPVALMTGVVNTLCFSSIHNGGWLQLAIFSWLFAQLTRTPTWKSAAMTAGAFGFGNFTVGIWWLFISMHVYGGMPSSIAIVILILFSLYLSLYPAFSAVLWSFLSGHIRHRSIQSTWNSAFTFASAWTLGEWLRGTVLNGFPWLAIGYPQVNGPFSGFAAIVGVYGVGWVLSLFSAFAVQAIYAVGSIINNNCNENTENISNSITYTSRVTLVFLYVGLAATLILLGLKLSHISWTVQSNKPLSIRLLQGNVKQNIKFDKKYLNASIAMYQRMITEKPADLVITPETAIPEPIEMLPKLFENTVRRFSEQTGTAVLLGTVASTINPDGLYDGYTNSLYGFTPLSQKIYRYDKHHLVPFGEFIPFGIDWISHLMKIPFNNFVRGNLIQPPFFVHNQPLIISICYEDIFGEEIAKTIRENQQIHGLLVNVTNLAWFGNTSTLNQHLQIAQMRALETGRPVLRSSNTGMTVAIDSHGNVIARLKPFTVGALDVLIKETSGFTPYVKIGNAAVLSVSIIILTFSVLFCSKLRNKN